MKYCLNSNVGPALLNEADEIAITKEDFGSVYMIAGRYPNATMIVPEPVDEFDWEGLKALVEAFPNRIIVCVAHAYALKICAELKIPFFYRYAVTSFQEVRALKELGAAYIVVAPPLFFQLIKLKHLVFLLEYVLIRVVTWEFYLPILPMTHGFCPKK